VPGTCLPEDGARQTIPGSRSDLVSEGVRRFLTLPVRMACFRTCLNADGAVFIWRIPIAVDVGSPHAWRMSGATVAELAERKWCSVDIDEEQRRYIVTTDHPWLQAPAWPQVCLRVLLDEAFAGRVIVSLSHPLAIKKRGFQ